MEKQQKDRTHKKYSIGVDQNGQWLQVSKHQFQLSNFFAKNDSLSCMIRKGYTKTWILDFSYDKTLKLYNQLIQSSLSFKRISRNYKVPSHQDLLQLNLRCEQYPSWGAKVTHSLRKVFVQKFSPYELKRDQTLATEKTSLSLLNVGEDPRSTRVLELAYADNGDGNFVKYEAQEFKSIDLMQNKAGFSFINNFKAVLPVSRRVCLIDRILCPDNIGYQAIGHSEPSSIKGPKSSDVPIQDVGTYMMLNHFGYFELKNISRIPQLTSILYWDFLFYPSYKQLVKKNILDSVLQNTRFSTGIGFTFNMGMIKLLLYYNMLNLGTQDGDKEKRGFGLTIKF